MATAFKTYIEKVAADYGGGKATEHTHRSSLEMLLESLERSIEASNDPKHTECGAPDFIVEKRRVPRMLRQKTWGNPWIGSRVRLYAFSRTDFLMFP